MQVQTELIANIIALVCGLLTQVVVGYGNKFNKVGCEVRGVWKQHLEKTIHNRQSALMNHKSSGAAKSNGNIICINEL